MAAGLLHWRLWRHISSCCGGRLICRLLRGRCFLPEWVILFFCRVLFLVLFSTKQSAEQPAALLFFFRFFLSLFGPFILLFLLRLRLRLAGNKGITSLLCCKRTILHWLFCRYMGGSRFRFIHYRFRSQRSTTGLRLSDWRFTDRRFQLISNF